MTQIALSTFTTSETIKVGITLIFKDKKLPRKGVAIRRPKEGEEGMPTLIVPYAETEKAELDYIMEEKTASEKERIEADKPIIERRLDDQGKYELRVKRGDA